MLGEKIQRLRKEKGMSQEQLAAQLTISRQAISKWELGESVPDTDNIVQLSKLFGVSTDYLLNDEYEEHAKEDSILQKQDANTRLPKSFTRKIVGLIFLGVGLIAIVFMLVFSDSWAALIIGIPLIASGIIYLTVNKHTALWCCWVVYIMFYTFFAIVTGSGFLWIFRGFGKNASLISLPLIPLVVVTSRLLYVTWKRKRS